MLGVSVLGAAVIAQRVAAALACIDARWCNSRPIPPPASAASTNRRDAVRSMPVALGASSATTAARPEHFSASSIAHSTSWVRRALNRVMQRGCNPRRASPGA